MKEEQRILLERLLRRHTRFFSDGFSLDLTADTEKWYRLITALGRRQAYRAMADYLCGAYRRREGKPFLFTESCVAFELGFHINAYLWTQGYPMPRHPATLLFSKDSLCRHCRTVEIQSGDTNYLRQRLMFGYRRGVRKELRRTQADPFRRLF